MRPRTLRRKDWTLTTKIVAWTMPVRYSGNCRWVYRSIKHQNQKLDTNTLSHKHTNPWTSSRSLLTCIFQTSPALEGGKLSKIPVAVGAGQRLSKCMSWSGDLTPGLRRRRQGEKYVTDPSQLNLKFKRHSTVGGGQLYSILGIERCSLSRCWSLLIKSPSTKQITLPFWEAGVIDGRCSSLHLMNTGVLHGSVSIPLHSYSLNLFSSSFTSVPSAHLFIDI